MRTPASLLHSSTTTSGQLPSPLPPPPPPPDAVAIDSDMVVILASLLCALICVVGLALVARCACRSRRRRSSSPASSSSSSSPPPPPPPPPPKGLKKKAIESLPTVTFSAAAASSMAGECAICLAEFADGEEMRVLPRCGHGFHVACVDMWLGSHATCPSCRASIVAAAAAAASPGGRCRRCGASCEEVAVEMPVSPSTPPAAAADGEGKRGGEEAGGSGSEADERFLP